MSKFRKKPVVVEAVQWMGKALDLRPRTFANAICICDSYWCGEPHIHTLEGSMLLSKGDWIVKGVEGEFYPCKPKIFAKTYEPEQP